MQASTSILQNPCRKKNLLPCFKSIFGNRKYFDARSLLNKRIRPLSNKKARDKSRAFEISSKEFLKQHLLWRCQPLCTQVLGGLAAVVSLMFKDFVDHLAFCHRRFKVRAKL